MKTYFLTSLLILSNFLLAQNAKILSIEILKKSIQGSSVVSIDSSQVLSPDTLDYPSKIFAIVILSDTTNIKKVSFKLMKGTKNKGNITRKLRKAKFQKRNSRSGHYVYKFRLGTRNIKRENMHLEVALIDSAGAIITQKNKSI
jgi:hypothetical protein